MAKSARKRWGWVIGTVVVVLLAAAAWIVVPILTHQNAGISTPIGSDEEWPTEAKAVGDDGRTRTIDVHTVEPGAEVDTSALAAGDRIVVSGSGFDVSRGIYVAICKIPDQLGEKPGPCLGGVPDTGAQQEGQEGAIQFGPSNWVNNDWAWKLFGARSYDDTDTGTFTAYLELPAPTDEGIDCRADACGIFTRNDHTALGDRVQDVHVPVAYRG